MKRETKPISVEEAVEKNGTLGQSKKMFKKKIQNKQNKFFTQLWCGIVFGKRKQKNDDEYKLIAKMPSGKWVFPDKEENEDEIVPDTPYICLIYEPIDEYTGKDKNAAFARLICREYMPKILVHPDGSVWMLWRNEKGEREKRMTAQKSFGYRLIDAHKKFEKMGFDEVRVVYVKNKRKQN